MPKTKTHAKKRYGHHQKQTPHFLKTYWPYMPLLLIISLMVLVGTSSHRHKRGLLSYTTNLSAPALLNDTNLQRQKNHAAPLHLNAALSAAAQSKAEDMAGRNYWSHNTPDGNPPWVFIDKAGYVYQKAGENLAYGFASSYDTVVGWMNSPSHRENLLDTSYQDVGFGYVNTPNYQGEGAETIIVAMYGSQLIPLPPSNSTSILGSSSAGISTTAAADKVQAEPSAHNVAISQLLTAGQAPWINVALIVITLVSLFALLLRHSLKLRRVFIYGERFALHHPLFDITLLSFLGLCLMLVQTVGSIR